MRFLYFSYHLTIIFIGFSSFVLFITITMFAFGTLWMFCLPLTHMPEASEVNVRHCGSLVNKKYLFGVAFA